MRYPWVHLPRPVPSTNLVQLEAGPESQSADVDRFIILAEESWLESTTTPGTQPQTFALIKIDLGTCYFFIPLNRILHSLYVHSVGHKDGYIIIVRGHREDETGGNPDRPTTRLNTPPNASRSRASSPRGCGTSCWYICGTPVWIRWSQKLSPKTDGPSCWRPWLGINWSAKLSCHLLTPPRPCEQDASCFGSIFPSRRSSTLVRLDWWRQAADGSLRPGPKSLTLCWAELWACNHLNSRKHAVTFLQ